MTLVGIPLEHRRWGRYPIWSHRFEYYRKLHLVSLDATISCGMRLLKSQIRQNLGLEMQPLDCENWNINAQLQFHLSGNSELLQRKSFRKKNDFSETKVCSKVIDAVSHFANVVIIENQVTKIYRLNETLGPQQRLVKQKVTSEKVR